MGQTHHWLFPETRAQEKESFVKRYWKPNGFGKRIGFQVNQVIDNVIKHLFIQRASSHPALLFYMGKTDFQDICDLVILLLKR